MPKTVGYTFASINKSLELARAVDELGGNSSVAMCAEKLGKKVSGGFQQIIQSAAKYGFVERQKGELATTSLFKDIKLAYSDSERKKLLQIAFLNVPLFKVLCDRFNNQEIPISHFNKLLIKEYGVSENMGQRVKTHFVDGAKEVGLMSPDNRIVSTLNLDGADTDAGPSSSDVGVAGVEENQQSPSLDTDSYSVKISGPGICSTISIADEGDLEIVEIMLKKIKKKLGDN